jgi:hypothetical protein
VKKNHCRGRLSFKTQLKIEYLLPYTGRKVLENIPGSGGEWEKWELVWPKKICIFKCLGLDFQHF